MKRLIFILIFFLTGNIAYCQQDDIGKAGDTTDLSNLTIGELSKLKSRYAATDMEKTISNAIEAASKKPLSLRNTPSIVSVITEDEIKRSGARDLMELLKIIPGIEFNVDVEGVVAISFRGMWANEGNVLLQIDGQEMNEIAYASLQMGNHYPINQIKTIEIVRGPGSAIYGGCAEYAVINIKTKTGEDIKGINAGIMAGQTDGTYSRQDITLAIGNNTNKINYSIAALMGRGQRSNLNYTDVFNTTFNMAGQGNLNPTNINGHIDYKDFSIRFIYDGFSTTTRDGYVNALTKSYPCNFESEFFELKYHKAISKKLQLLARANFKRSVPWNFNGTADPADSSYGTYKIIANRIRVNVAASWDLISWFNANAGAELVSDNAYKSMSQLFKADNSDHVNYLNYAPYAQFLIKTHFANITAGARYDVSNGFGSAFNPRLGITKKVGIANFKLLYASSFRAPSIENIQYDSGPGKLKPEQSNTLEFETSLKITKEMYLSMNLFDITTTNAIRYYVRTDSTITGDPDGYRNSNKIIGTQGLELEYKFKSDFGFLTVAYSFYTAQNKHVDSANLTCINKNTTLGTAQHKLAIIASINLTKHIYISPSASYMGDRYGYASVDPTGNEVISLFKPQIQYNCFLGFDRIAKGFSGGIGINNITDERILYIQAYNSLHAPLPGLGREFYLNLNYNIDFNKKQKK